MAAGLATLSLISVEGFHDALAKTTARLVSGLKDEADSAGVPLRVTQVGGMFGLLFTEAEQVINYSQVAQCNTGAFKKFFHLMLERGIYLAPSAFEAGFVSSAHSDEHIQATISAAREAFGVMAGSDAGR